MVEDKKKQIPLRLSPSLYNKIAQWAEEDFRSINGQIEYLLYRCAEDRYKTAGEQGDSNSKLSPDKDPEE